MKKFNIDFIQQWTDSYNFDIFCIGCYNDGQMFTIGLTILGLGIDLEFWKL